MVTRKEESLDLELFKKSLLDRKLELEGVLADLSNEGGEDPQGQDLGDQALSSSMEALRQSLQETEHAEYRMILDALQAIEDGTYGICIDCDHKISEKRLKYYPNALRCISCQEVLEEKAEL
jgi:DnaK suppressor protein